MRRGFKGAAGIFMSVVLAVSAITVSGVYSGTADAADAPKLADGTKIQTTGRVSVHDPSIVDGMDGYYYIFGSHMAWARSKDLTNWTEIRTNINTNYASVFKIPGEWAAKGSSSYALNGNLWAPDVIYNPTMKKWCMYMSVNGDDYTSSIALATADSVTGPYAYEGIVVYSGFRASGTRSYTYTDYQKATGSTDVSRYLTNGAWNSSYGVNAIDPCLRYDENGDLWMSYGSWFGGIYMLKLDKNTGLRDYTYTYKTETNKSDAYLGIKIAGGYGQSGEGSYIVYDKESGYYYLYLSYNGLDATDDFSGYHLRMYRSKKITGPYTDAAGRSAVYTSAAEDQSLHGVKLFGNYTFSSLAGNGDNSANGYMSGGHNSAFIDGDGNHFLIYHTRFNTGNEWHAVRVHQQFLNEDGWLVTAPYEYRGSKISGTGYSADEIAGCYEIVNQGLTAQTVYTGMITNYQVVLSKDGTIGGDVSGTWSEKDGSYLATMVIAGVEYKGVFFKQYDESASHKEVMTFSLIGDNNVSIWGSKISDDAALIWKTVSSAFDGTISRNVNIPQFSSVKLTTDSKYLTVSGDGTKAVYTAPKEDTLVTLTGEVTVSGKKTTYTKKVKVMGYENAQIDSRLVAYYSFDDSLNKDSSAGSHTLTVNGSTKAVDAKRGNVAYFDGTNDYMQLPSSVTASDNFTFMAWVKPSAYAAWARVFDFGDSDGNSIFLTTHGYTPECMRAAYAVNAEEQHADCAVIMANMYIDHWVHMAVTVNAETKTMNFYMDGRLAGTTALTSNITDNFKGTRNYLGKSQYSTDSYFAGYMDDVMIFNSALCEKEIIAYMNNGLEEEEQTVDTDAGVVVIKPGTYLSVEENAVLVNTSSGDNAVAKKCTDGRLLGLSEGVAELETVLADGTKGIIRILVEEDQDVTYGDVNSDGRIDIYDMEEIQKHLLQIKTMDEKAMKAGSVNRFDGALSILDMETIQKHILNLKEIHQFK